MIDSDVLNNDVTLTGVMEGKTFTISIYIDSSITPSQIRTYSAKYGERFTLPSCPFSAPSGSVFKNYICNGNTYNVGSGFTVTGDMGVTCNWMSIYNFTIKYKHTVNELSEVELIKFNPSLSGETIRVQYYKAVTNSQGTSGHTPTNDYRDIVFNNSNLNTKVKLNTVLKAGDNVLLEFVSGNFRGVEHLYNTNNQYRTTVCEFYKR